MSADTAAPRLISERSVIRGSGRAYWLLGFFDARGVSIPVVVTVFAEEIYAAPRKWAERAYPKMIYYSYHHKGSHFAAWEQPQLLSEDLRSGFRPLRLNLTGRKKS